MEEHNCKPKPYGELVVKDTDFWRAMNIGSGFIDKIKHCPWCGEKLC